MSRYMILLFATILFATICSVLSDDTKYTTKYDDIDVDMILNTPRLRTQYIKCYMGTAACLTPEAKFLKDVLPEVLVTKCAKCTVKQKIIFDKVITWFEENDKETWKTVLSMAINEHLNKKS
ncbi:hypothetical protein M0802_012649 [Mischocyttarus mexicanus]|nr:hypothetical protein M0802_012649 [Mischocyttarus mexicanus]